MERKNSRTLGRILKIYRARPLQMGDFWRWFVPLLSIPLAIFAYGLYRSLIGYTQYGEAAGALWGESWFLLGLASLAPVILFTYLRVSATRPGIALHTNGLRFKRVRNGRPIQWKQVSGITSQIVEERILGREVRTRYAATLHPSQGKPIVLPANLEDLPELIQEIKERVYAGIYPELKDRLAQGHTVYFGPVHLHRDNITFSGKTYPWEKVTGLQVEKAMLWLETASNNGSRTKKSKLRSQDIPNLELIIQLVDEVITS